MERKLTMLLGTTLAVLIILFTLVIVMEEDESIDYCLVLGVVIKCSDMEVR